MSLTYITIGAILAIWSSVWFFGIQPETRVSQSVCAGLFLTGIVFLAIGFGIGQIGRAARAVELPPDEHSHPQTHSEPGVARPPTQTAASPQQPAAPPTNVYNT
jgi:hypothetical protein